MFGDLLTSSYISVVSPADGVIVDRPTVLTSFNSTETITCLALGGPDNMFEWKKQEVIVSNSDVLELTMITGSDGGLYVCNVTNDAGYGTANTSVIGTYFINFLMFRYISCIHPYNYVFLLYDLWHMSQMMTNGNAGTIVVNFYLL